jgi:hypothetical protein
MTPVRERRVERDASLIMPPLPTNQLVVQRAMPQRARLWTSWECGAFL